MILELHFITRNIPHTEATFIQYKFSGFNYFNYFNYEED